MRPIRAGLLVALCTVLLTPAAAFAAKAPKAPPTAPATYTPAQLKKGAAEGAGIVQRAAVPCQMSASAWAGGSGADKKTGTPQRDMYEVACAGQLGYILQADKDGPVLAFSCLEMMSSANLNCKLAENAGNVALLQAALAKNAVPCTVEKTRSIGATADTTFLELGCQGAVGYVARLSRPVDLGKPIKVDNCLSFDLGTSNLKCTLSDMTTRLGVVDGYVTAAKVTCPLKEKRYIGLLKDGTTAFEAACQDGKGYVLKLDQKGGIVALECVKAPGLCELSDARLALTEQAGLYSRLAKTAGSACEVVSYAVFPSSAGQEVVELTCKDGSEAVGLFPASGKGRVVDCDHALVAGFRCAPGKADYSHLTADLKTLGKPDCMVSEVQLRSKNPKGNQQIEVACKDGLPGYVVEYDSGGTKPIDAIGCRLTGCGLPANNRPKS